MSTDELTGVQALERKAPNLPVAPGKVERREFEYIRHGTQAFILSRDVSGTFSADLRPDPHRSRFSGPRPEGGRHRSDRHTVAFCGR